MSSVLCFVCHNGVDSATTEETREKYRDVVGMNLCPDSHLCFICCHMVKKLWLFKSVCLKRTLEYPVLFNEICTISLHRSNVETLVLCAEENCQANNTDQLNFHYNNETHNQSNEYVELEEERNDCEYLTEKVIENYSINGECYSVNDQSDFLTETFNNELVDLDFVDNFDVGSVFVENLDVGKTNDVDFDINVNAISLDDIQNVTEVNFDETLSQIANDNIVVNIQIPQDPGPSKTGKVTGNKPRNKINNFEKLVLCIDEQKAELEAQRKTKKYMDAEFKCYNCAMGFLFKESYQAHMMRHEESNGEYVCPLCFLRFANPEVERSHTSSHAERYRCLRCDENVTKRQRLAHAQLCHQVHVDNAACHMCGRVFKDRNCLQRHIRRVHLNKMSNRCYPCNVCGKNYNNPASLRTHMVKHVQRKFPCDQCDATFNSPYILTQHKKKHNKPADQKDHVCVTCGVGYASRKSLMAHMRNAPQHQETVFDCPICQRSCPNRSSLNVHIRRVHTASKDFACSLCNNKYTSNKSLLRHMRDHNLGDQPKLAQCFRCGKNFKGNSTLNRHLKEVCRLNKFKEDMAAYYAKRNAKL